MIVEEIMKKNVLALSPEDTIEKAINLLNANRIRHIPILDRNESIVGIVSDRDIRDVTPSIFYKEEHQDVLHKPIETIMTKDVIIGSPLDFVEEAAAIFYEHKIGCLPIEKDGKLIGIVTESDLLHTLVQLTGANQPSSHLELKVPNRAGMLAEAANIIKNRNINITSVLVYPDSDLQYKILVFRVQTMNPTHLIDDLAKQGYEIRWPDNRGFVHD